ncbi:MAG: hypothetical protein AAF483_02630 [Planctomycetota bacterium]
MNTKLQAKAIIEQAREEKSWLHELTSHDWSTTWFWLYFVLVLSIAALVLLLVFDSGMLVPGSATTFRRDISRVIIATMTRDVFDRESINVQSIVVENWFVRHFPIDYEYE